MTASLWRTFMPEPPAVVMYAGRPTCERCTWAWSHSRRQFLLKAISAACLQHRELM